MVCMKRRPKGSLFWPSIGRTFEPIYAVEVVTKKSLITTTRTFAHNQLAREIRPSNSPHLQATDSTKESESDAQRPRRHEVG